MKPAHLPDNIAHTFELCSPTRIRKALLKNQNKPKLDNIFEFKAASSEMPHYGPFSS